MKPRNMYYLIAVFIAIGLVMPFLVPGSDIENAAERAAIEGEGKAVAHQPLIDMITMRTVARHGVDDEYFFDIYTIFGMRIAEVRPAAAAGLAAGSSGTGLRQQHDGVFLISAAHPDTAA